MRTSREIHLQNLSKSYRAGHETVKAVKGLTFTIPPGETTVLLGPSGCGKTTLLRCIAGLEAPNEGAIRVGDTTVYSAEKRINVAPEARQIGMVFQSYALWPHMTVAKNVAYPLHARRTPKSGIQRMVEEALERVACGHLADRYPRELSGGQQQRIAVARAIVGEPSVLLLDEPLSNLDAKLREQLRFELQGLAKSLGFTAVYVTHDQDEAMTLGDQVAVMNGGVIEQFGPPVEVFEKPQSLFVASFLGSMNILKGTLTSLEKETGAGVELKNGTFHASHVPQRDLMKIGDAVAWCFRPHDARLVSEHAHQSAAQRIPVRVKGSAHLGDSIVTLVDVEGEADATELSVHSDPRVTQVLALGARAYLEVDRERCHVFPLDARANDVEAVDPEETMA